MFGIHVFGLYVGINKIISIWGLFSFFMSVSDQKHIFARFAFMIFFIFREFININ